MPTQQTKTPRPEQVTMFIGAKTVACEGIGPQMCLLVKFEKHAAWELFYDVIAGFKHEEGFEYELLVNRIFIENPLADASSIEYELQEIVSKTEAAPTDSV